MKKLLYTLAVIFAYTLPVNAQKVFMGDLNTVPSFFTYNHNPYLLGLDANCINIYDTDINKLESININDAVERLYVHSIDNNGIGHNVQNARSYLTQTLFNDDADWEYIVPVYGMVTDNWGYTREEAVSYTIKKTNGTILGSISADKWKLEIYIINDVVYAATEHRDNNKYTYYFYTLPEFRKLILNDSNGVKAAPAMVRTDKPVSDIAGRRVSESHKGIVIKDGKKMITK